MNREQLANQIEQKFKEQFPLGWISARPYKGLGDADLIGVSFGLVPEDKLSHGYHENDPVHHKFLIRKENDKFVSEKLFGGISYNPSPENSYLAMETEQTKYRKTTGDGNKVLKSFEKLFNHIQEELTEKRENVYGYDKYPKEAFGG